MTDAKDFGSRPSNASTSATKPLGARKDSATKGDLADLRNKAKEIGGALADQVASNASGVVEKSKQAASNAGDQLSDAAQEKKAAGADYVTGIADAVRRAAGEFDKDVPQAANYIRQAADQISNVADSVKNRNFRELFGTVEDFARKQPTAFLGLTFLAGFAAVRFIKSSGEQSTELPERANASSRNGSA
jgi:hypothetical protein